MTMKKFTKLATSAATCLVLGGLMTFAEAPARGNDAALVADDLIYHVSSSGDDYCDGCCGWPYLCCGVPVELCEGET